MSGWSALWLYAAGMLTLVPPPLEAATTKMEITDGAITLAVERELWTEKGVSPDSMDVSTSQGIVTLSGSTDNLLSKERALQIAESIRGVRGVIDRTFVTRASRPDADVRQDILTALQEDPATESYQVTVVVQDSVATLSGRVGSRAAQQLASRIARGVKGITEARNEFTIDYRTKRTDSEITGDIKARLQWDVWLNGDRLHAGAKDGKVTLSGTVGSAISRSRAFEDAWVEGVTSVDDRELKVDPDSCQDAQRKFEYAILTDGQIKQAVQAALRLDPRVSAFSPHVTVENGVAILGGSVGNLKAKTAAEEDAKNIVGVWRIDNLLKVRPKQRRTDAEMEKQLKAALFWDPLLDRSTVEATVNNCVAYLSGAVDSALEKAEAHDIASRIKGVVLVRNHLKVEPAVSVSYYDWPYYSSYDRPSYNRPLYGVSETFNPKPYMSDEQIKKNIEDAFFWSPFVVREDIGVTVHGGVATLSGTVASWIGYGQADKAAHKSGATEVLNQIKVKTAGSAPTHRHRRRSRRTR